MSDTTLQIVFTDVDGTLVDNNHHPMPESSGVLQRVARRMPLCLVSARSPEGLYPIQNQLGFSGPLACFSGAYVLDHEGSELLSATIPTRDALDIKRYLDEELPDICVATYGYHTWIVGDRSDPRIEREEYYVQATSRACSDLAQAFGEGGVHKFLLMGEPADILAAERRMAERYPSLNVVRSNETLCEVMCGEASKRRAVEVLCERYGALPHNAIAFGDGPNDCDMLEAVGHSYAMANAEDEVKRVAKRVVPWTNEECGVARMLDMLVPDIAD